MGKTIKFWAVNLNNGDGSSTTVQFQTKKQAKIAADNNDEYQGEDWHDLPYEDSIKLTDDDKIVLGEDAEYYLKGIREDM